MAGADVVIDYRSENVVERVREATDGAGVDRVIEVDTAANAVIDMEVVRFEGIWVVYGSGSRQFSLPFFPMISRNILVRLFIVMPLLKALALLNLRAPSPDEWPLAGAQPETAWGRLPTYTNRACWLHSP